MQRQLGVFLYDTLNYAQVGFKDLEAYLDQPEVPSEPPTGKVILTKVTIPHKIVSEVFQRLDLMGVSASHLYDSHEGAAADVINAYNYGRKTGYAWDVAVKPLSERPRHDLPKTPLVEALSPFGVGLSCSARNLFASPP